MRLEHITGMEAGYTMGLRPDGRELLVVCIKGTFVMPENGEKSRLAEEQVPLIEADTFTGEPGFSAPIYESDYAPHKPFCDVLLNGSAYAPNGKPATKVPVALQIGNMVKSFNVVGDRFWMKDGTNILSTRPIPFVKKAFSYDRAFGGVDDSYDAPAKRQVYMANPVGTGFHYYLDRHFIEGKPVPNTEEGQRPVTRPNGNYTPMGFGPIGRAWQVRVPFAGTYDQNWVDTLFPFLPPDFDDRYYQAAPPDQQIPYPQGGEPVGLFNLTPQGRTVFCLPKKNMLVWYLLQNGEEVDMAAVLDTIILEPDAGRFMLVWRTALPLQRNMFEVEMVVIGDNPDARDEIGPSRDIEFPLWPPTDTENGNTSESQTEKV